MSFSKINSFNLSLSELFFLFITAIALTPNLAFQYYAPLRKCVATLSTYLIQQHSYSIPFPIILDVEETLNISQEMELNRKRGKLSLLFRHNRMNRYTPFNSRIKNVVPEIYTNYFHKIPLKNSEPFLLSMRC